VAHQLATRAKQCSLLIALAPNSPSVLNDTHYSSCQHPSPHWGEDEGEGATSCIIGIFQIPMPQENRLITFFKKDTIDMGGKK